MNTDEALALAQEATTLANHFTASGNSESADLLYRLSAGITALAQERDEAVRAIREHNDECQQSCGVGDQEAVRCKYRPYFKANGRRCPECRVYWMIEYPVAAQERKP
jgi:hypothetical protein